MAGGLRALMIAPVLPADAGNGLAMRLGLFLEALSRAAETDLVVLDGSRGASASALTKRLRVSRVPIDDANHDTRLSFILRTADPRLRLEAYRAYRRSSLSSRVTSRLQADLAALGGRRGYRLVHAGRAYMTEAALPLSRAAVLTLDLDEDDFSALRSLALQAERTGDAISADFLRADADFCDWLVANHGAAFGRLTVASEADRSALQSRHRQLEFETVSNAVAVPGRRARPRRSRDILFVGSFGYAPNRDGIRWFAERVWPRLHSVAPDATLTVIGSGGPALDAPAGGIRELGFVPDLSPHYDAAAMAIAPLFAGGGSRIKLLEAAAHHAPIVATPAALAGLPFADGTSVLVAEDAEGFARACLSVLDDPSAAERRADAAFRLVVALHDREHIVAKLAASYREILESAPR